MQTPGKKSEHQASELTRFRRLIRGLHRDIGYVAVGLTAIYAMSGIAVNHVADWDPSFSGYEKVHELGPLPAGDQEAARAVLAKLNVKDIPREVFRAAPTRLDVVLDGRTLHVDPTTGRVIEQGQSPRFFLRFANWLHLNRGKKAWGYVADLYALALLFLAGSGMVMIAGKNGFLFRGAVLVAIGVAIPVCFVVLSR